MDTISGIIANDIDAVKCLFAQCKAADKAQKGFFYYES